MSESNFISVKACPICGEAPQRFEESLGRPGGGGYPGYFTYEYKCECCRLINGGEWHDLYCTKEEARDKAKASWNRKVDEVIKYLERTWVAKK